MEKNYKELLFTQKWELEFLKNELENVIWFLWERSGDEKIIEKKFWLILNKLELMIEKIK